MGKMLQQDETTRKWICMSFLFFILAALPFWYFEKNLDNGLIEDLNNVSFSLEKAIPKNIINVGLIGSLNNETNNFLVKDVLKLFELNDSSIQFQFVKISDDAKILKAKTLAEFYSVISAGNSSSDEHQLYIFKNDQFSFTIPTLKWKRSLFFPCQDLELKSLESFLEFLQQPVSPRFLDIYSKSSHLSDRLNVKITSLSVGPGAIIDDAFMPTSVITPVNTVLDKFNFILKSEIKLQRRLMQSFVEPPKFDEGKKIYFFDGIQSSTFLNTGTWNLDSTARKMVNLNILFVNSDLEYPVYFLAQDGSSLKPSICYPDWGCVLLFDKRKEKNLQEISQFAQESLGYLLGVHEFPEILNNPLNVAAWEEYVKEFVLSRHLQSSISQSISYIESLRNILESFSNISIASAFQSTILNIRDTLKSSIESITSRKLAQAADEANKAARLSESAFFHPSLLGKLYFPDEHKYAVYLPLLLPTFLPIVIGTVKLLLRK